MSAICEPYYERLKLLAPGAVLTNGCFDTLHVGHIRLLERASMFGSQLVVAINSDASVRMLKGEGRPIFWLSERMEMIAALSYVTLVTSFPDNNVANVIRHLRPHCWIKGFGYTMDTLDKSEVQAANDVGAAIVILPKFGEYSTTGILERMKG
jgi:D-beta-D-heptose 7-phosphate kinase/D-beta-D-heptose 1-phosphate adenosyltransferase